MVSLSPTPSSMLRRSGDASMLVAAGEQQAAGTGAERADQPAAREDRSSRLLLRQAIPAGDHRAELVERPGEHDHQQVDDDEGDEQASAQMKWIERADWRPPNRSSSQGQAASMPGDMVRPVSTISGSRTKITPTIAELLQDVVAPRRLAGGEAQPGMVLDVLPEMARRELVARRREVALDVAVDEAPEPEQQAGHDEQPGEDEMPVPRAGEIVARGIVAQRRKGALDSRPTCRARRSSGSVSAPTRRKPLHRRRCRSPARRARDWRRIGPSRAADGR